MRTTILLLIANAAVAALLFWTAAPTRTVTRRTLVPADRDVRTATRIEFSASKTLPALVLATDARKRWHLEGPDGPLANQGAVAQIVDMLRRAPILPFETGAAGSLGLTPPTRTVTVRLADESTLRVAIGTVIGLGVFVRFDDEADARLTHLDVQALLEHQAASLRELRPFPFAALDVERFRLVRRTLEGLQDYRAERRWLTWFFAKPYAVRGDARTIDGMVAALISLERTRAIVSGSELPTIDPSVEVTLETGDDAITVDLWAISQAESSWIARVRGEPQGFKLVEPKLRQVLAPFDALWDPRLIHDSSRQVAWVEWALDGAKPVRVARRVTDRQFEITKPVPAPCEQEAADKFIQDLIRMRAVGVEPAGAPNANGFDRPIGRLTIHATLGDGEQTFVIGAPRNGVCRVRVVERPDLEFLVPEVTIRERIPENALALVDRELTSGDWKVLSRFEIRRADGSTVEFTNRPGLGTDLEPTWQRRVFTANQQGTPTPVSGLAMRRAITALTALRATRAVAWSTTGAPAAWGCDAPRYVISFHSDAPGRGAVRLAVGPIQPDPEGLGDEWFPVWLAPGDARLSERPFVYRISAEQLRPLEKLIPR